MNEMPSPLKQVAADTFPRSASKPGSLISQDKIFLKKVKNHILQNLANEQFSVQDLAEHIHLSVSQLNRKLNKISGRSAGKLILEMRLAHAANLLSHNTASISDIAYQTGFRDQAYFCRRFKKHFKCTPSTFRKRTSSS